jgi:hypothetical protein
LQFASRNGESATTKNRAAELFLRQSFRRVRGYLAGVNNNDDPAILATAESVLGK